MRELIIRSVSGVVFVALVIGSILFHPIAYSFLLLFVVGVGTFEMCRLHGVNRILHIVIAEAFSLGFFFLAALVALGCVSKSWLWINLLFLLLPFLWALFSSDYKFCVLASLSIASLCFLALPAALMIFMFRPDLFDVLSGPRLIILVYVLIWVNDTFAYLTGSLLGKHKLFYRVSPGKTIEGSLGGLLFSLLGLLLYVYFTNFLPLSVALGLGLVSVVFGTLGDLCESMLKRQAGVKDSGRLIPGHGGILDRFDSVMFAVPFIFVYLQLI